MQAHHDGYWCNRKAEYLKHKNQLRQHFWSLNLKGFIALEK